MSALAKDIALHGLLSKLQDGQICPAEIAQIRERLGRIWSSPYVGQWVIRSVLWCSASADLGGRTEYVVPLVLLTS